MMYDDGYGEEEQVYENGMSDLGSGGGYNPTPLNSYGSSILLLTSPDDALYDLELSFRNWIEDGQGGYKIVGVPLMNDFGISKVLGLVRSNVNRVVNMSNFEKGYAERKTFEVIMTLNKDLLVNGKLYGITNISNKALIIEMCDSLVYASIRRGYAEGDKRFLKGSQQETTVRTETTGNKGGGFGWFSGGGKK